MNEVEFYRSKENKAISNSKLKAWLSSPAYYKARYIDGTIKDEPTPSMLLGSMIDCAVSAGRVEAIGQNYVEKTKGRQDYAGLTPVTESAISDARAISENLMHQPFYKQMKKSKCVWQKPLYGKIGEVECCGLPDCYTDKARWTFNEPALIDLKTSTNSHFQSAKKWYWHGVELGYWTQLALYRFLVAEHLKVKPEEVHCYHIVAGTTKVGKWPIKLFKIEKTILDVAFEEFSYQATKLWQAKEFIDEPVCWVQTEVINCP